MKESVPTENAASWCSDHNKLCTACTEDAITDRKKKKKPSYVVYLNQAIVINRRVFRKKVSPLRRSEKYRQGALLENPIVKGKPSDFIYMTLFRKEIVSMRL